MTSAAQCEENVRLVSFTFYEDSPSTCTEVRLRKSTLLPVIPPLSSNIYTFRVYVCVYSIKSSLIGYILTINQEYNCIFLVTTYWTLCPSWAVIYKLHHRSSSHCLWLLVFLKTHFPIAIIILAMRWYLKKNKEHKALWTTDKGSNVTFTRIQN